MADPRVFHDKTKACKPKVYVKPSTYWVAVLRSVKASDEVLATEDFLWIKANAKISAQKIWEQYRLKYPGANDVVLKYATRVLDLSSSVKDLDDFGDQLIAIEAVQVDSHPTCTSQPPQTGNVRLTQPLSEKGLKGESFQRRTLRGTSDIPSPSAIPRVSSRSPTTQSLASESFSALFESVERQDKDTVAHPHPHRPTILQGSQRLSVPDQICNFTSGEPVKSHAFKGQPPLDDTVLETLEKGVLQGVKLLSDLKVPLLSLPEDLDAKEWIQRIETLSTQAVKAKTIVGVIGNTGCGKSSIINAILDEERLVPTNCMRACTAVVTEISYNEGNEQPYRAQIEFVELDEWKLELETLFRDIVDRAGNVSKESSKEDSEAGIAYAKIKAVYPRKTRENMANSSIEQMLDEVSDLLGTTKHFAESDPQIFHKRLQHYVDSKEKNIGTRLKGKRKEPKQMEYWPMIRVVRLFVKSQTLSSGAVIVDLPGVQDANIARAAVAERYIRQCTGLFIVTPINRAVDDKAAKSLLGESFKRQLRLDGSFSAVTFICSKTDDISLTEASDSLDMDEDLGGSWAELDLLAKQQERLTKKLQRFEVSRETCIETIDEAEEKLETWERLKKDQARGKTVFTPYSKPRSRKRKATYSGRSQKKNKMHGFTESSDEDSPKSDSEDDKGSGIQGSAASCPTNRPDNPPMTEEQIKSMIMGFQSAKREGRVQKADMNEKIIATRKEITAIQATERRIEDEVAAKCIAGRNKYSKGAIQQDFAEGIKEIDQELAAEEDDQSFDPDVEFRDYREVARQLKVFCVSSRGYQKLQGRLRKDTSVAGFKKLEETEIPQLQRHCINLTKAARSSGCRRFLNNLNQLLNSMALWASGESTGYMPTTEHSIQKADVITEKLKILEGGLNGVPNLACRELNEEMENLIFDKYDAAVAAAIEASSVIAGQWGAPVNRDNRATGGVHFMTYKAICRRHGVYTNSQGAFDWNSELVHPMLKILASGWEKVFTCKIPAVMAKFACNAQSLLQAAHHDITLWTREMSTEAASLDALGRQLAIYQGIFDDIANTGKEFININQKEINREIAPTIMKAMMVAYDACEAETGPGSFARMKKTLTTHVDATRHSMFRQSLDDVRSRLVDMVKGVETMLRDKTNEVVTAFRRDLYFMGNQEVTSLAHPVTPEALLRKDVLRVINDAKPLTLRYAAGHCVGDEDGEANEAVEQAAKVESFESLTEGPLAQKNTSLLGDQQAQAQ